MYLISQVSKITGLTKKALRYYDEQGLLTPSLRNEENQYRLYDEKDMEKARLIVLLRKFDFSISEIRDALSVADSADDLSYVLKEKIQYIESNIAKEKALIKEMNRYLEPENWNKADRKYEITMEHIDAIQVAALRVKTAYDQMGKHIPKLMRAVKGEADGRLITCYHDEEYVEAADMELCMPVKKRISSSEVTCKMLPKITALCTTHYGSYETISSAYQALFQYVNEKGLTVYTPFREIYVKGPGLIFKGNPGKYVTKIFLPYR